MSICASVGLPVITRINSCIHDGFVGFTELQEVEQEFLYYKLKELEPRFATMGQTGSQANLNSDLVRECKIALPDINEQRAIAQALGDTDELIDSLDKLIVKKQNIKQAVMHDLLTGKKRLPGFSGEWNKTVFGDLTSPGKKRVDPKKHNTRQFCIELEHIGQATGTLIGSTSVGQYSSLKSVFNCGDVLFGKLRAYLRKYWLADRPGICSTEIWVLKPNRQIVIPEFLSQIVRTDAFVEAASTAYGTHMPRSDWNVVKHLNFDIPSLEEQVAIAEVLSDIDSELATLEARRDKTTAIKQGMMQELLTGRTRLV
jgi:type I restriction enzyme S subunit